MSNIIVKWLVQEPVYYNVFRDMDLKPDIDSQNLKDMQFGGLDECFECSSTAASALPECGNDALGGDSRGADPVSTTVYVVNFDPAKLGSPAISGSKSFLSFQIPQ